MIGDFLHTTIAMMTPILWAALGGLFTQLGGMLNIGLEGMMLISAFSSLYTAANTGSLLLGILVGIGSSMLLAAIMGYVSLNLKANVFVVGLATNLFASGITVFLSSNLCGTKGTLYFQNAPELSEIKIPVIENIPILGDLLSGYDILDYLVFLAVIICFIIIFKTPYGFHLRSVGKNYRAAVSVGISVYKQRFGSFLISGFFAGIGGAALSLPIKTFVGGMTNGRGWIALVAVILGRGNPVGVLMASIIFGAASALSNLFQATTDISPKLLLTVPFLVTLAIMIFYSVKRKKVNAQ
jgi:simple sugar transport system permease protein